MEEKEICRIVGKSGIVHSVYSGGDNHTGVLLFETLCGSLLYNSLTAEEHKDVAYSVTEEPVTCKKCLRSIACQNTPSIEVGCFIAIDEEAEEDPFIYDSLDSLMEALKQNYGDDLNDMLEEGAFTFYKGIKIDVQVEVEVFKRVLKLSEC